VSVLLVPTSQKIMWYNKVMCKIDGCSNKVRVRNLCGRHWNAEQYGMCVNSCPTPASSKKGICPNCMKRGGAPTRHNIGSVVNNDKQFWCVMCKEVKPIEDRSSHKNRCNVHQAQLRRESWLRRTYNITIDDYNRMSVDGCNSCGDKPKVLMVDHDHSCCGGNKSCGACVRGVLCGSCNSGIGHAKDDPSRLRKMAGYLEKSTMKK
jgi:hypothetical protein